MFRHGIDICFSTTTMLIALFEYLYVLLIDQTRWRRDSDGDMEWYLLL